jgi:glycerophosphoryl diester phosphodiesterase
MSAAPRPHVPEIIAHRGASRDRYENTLAAFAAALDQGADAIELDVHATIDGAVVVHHDAVLRSRDPARAGQPLAIAESTLVELRRHPLADGSAVPTLEEVCRLVDDRATLYVEIKSAGLDAVVPALLDRHPRVRSAVHSFDHRASAAVHRHSPPRPVGILLSSYLLDPVHAARAAEARDVWMADALIDAPLVATLHAARLRLIAWTVDDPVRARVLAALGVDGVCTNSPGLVRQALTVREG